MEFIAIPTKNSVVAAIKIVGMRLDTDFDIEIVCLFLTLLDNKLIYLA
jgi:hypothetical protein